MGNLSSNLCWMFEFTPYPWLVVQMIPFIMVDKFSRSLIKLEFGPLLKYQLYFVCLIEYHGLLLYCSQKYVRIYTSKHIFPLQNMSWNTILKILNKHIQSWTILKIKSCFKIGSFTTLEYTLLLKYFCFEGIICSVFQSMLISIIKKLCT